MNTSISVKTADNVTLNGTHLAANNPKATVLLNPGTATKTTYYLPFAEFLVSQGFDVVVWNYRGFCESKTSQLKGCSYQYSDIGRFDMPAMIDKAKSINPTLPLYCVGHSAGGQQIGLAANYQKLDALVAVAVSAGYFGYMPTGYRIKANFFFRLFSPITGALFKYVPAKKMNFMEDLPVGFTREWSAWCREKQLFFSNKFYGKSIAEGTYKNFDIPTYVFTADDDEICTEQNVHNFWRNVTSKHPIAFKRYQSAQLPAKKVGHFGYFRKHNQAIWHDILTALNETHNAKQSSAI